MKDKLNWKNGIYKEDLKIGKRNCHYLRLQNRISKVLVAILWGKNYRNRVAQKRSDPCASSKTYWSISPWFYDGVKLLIIPSQLFHSTINIKMESDFKIKANYFNSFFCFKVCCPCSASIVSNLSLYVLTSRLSSLFQRGSYISQINALNTNKANGQDVISNWIHNQGRAHDFQELHWY